MCPQIHTNFLRLQLIYNIINKQKIPKSSQSVLICGQRKKETKILLICENLWTKRKKKEKKVI